MLGNFTNTAVLKHLLWFVALRNVKKKTAEM